MAGLVDRGFERLADIDPRFSAAAFFLALLGYTMALLLEARGYPADPRLFPMIVGLPLTLLLITKVLMLLLQDRVHVQSVGFFDDLDVMDVASDDGEPQRESRYRRELSMIIWIGGLGVLIYLIGNLLAIPVFIFTFILAYERDLVRAALVSAITFAFVYLLFAEVLGASLWRGVIELGGILS